MQPLVSVGGVWDFALEGERGARCAALRFACCRCTCGWLVVVTRTCGHTPLTSPPLPLPPSCACSKPGYYATSTRSATCALCPVGKQCPLIATAAPQTCGKGYYSNKQGARLCSPCPTNTYQPGTSPTQCITW